MRSRCFAAALLLFVTVLSGCNAQPQLAELNIRSLSDDSSTFEYSDTDSEITVFSETPETFLPVPTEDTTVLVTDDEFVQDADVTDSIQVFDDSDTVYDTVPTQAVTKEQIPETLPPETVQEKEIIETEVFENFDTQSFTSEIVETAVSDTVYWVQNGEVWHISINCPSLSRSKNILSGSQTDAKAAGKSRVCKRCGG